MTFKALGVTQAVFQGLETFPKPDTVDQVTMESDEVTALCPVTGQPDQYTIIIRYWPRDLCVESKSLKLYFQTYRNEGVFCEALSAKICADLDQALRPARCEVWVKQKPRGGISITAHAVRGETIHE